MSGQPLRSGFRRKAERNRHRLHCRQFGLCEIAAIVRHLQPGGFTATEVMALPWHEQVSLMDETPTRPNHYVEESPTPDELAAIHVEKIETERREMAEREKRDAELYRRHLDDTNRKNNLRIMEQIREGFRRRER